MRFWSLLCFAAIWYTTLAFAQKPTAEKMRPVGGVDNEFVGKQFGDSCALLPGSAPLQADLDGDGIEDIVVVARCKNPLVDQAEYNFKVVDPYNAYFGFGDPKITTEFASEDPDRRGVSLLIIHGVGPKAWRSETPKAKFLVINLPFKQLAVKKMKMRKKSVMAIFAEEAHEGQGTISALYWDGKKYKYQPMGMSME
jgi:hypothetical protein